MQIQTESSGVRRLYDAELMGEHYDHPGIEFSADGTARVQREVGEALVASDRFPGITAAEDDADDPAESDGTDAE